MATPPNGVRYGGGMACLVIKILSLAGFLGGIIGLIAVPENAAMWPEKLRPVLAGMSKDDLILILFCVSAFGFTLVVFGPKLQFLAHGIGTIAIKIGRVLVVGGASNEFIEIRHDYSYENIVKIYRAPEERKIRKRCFVGVKNITHDKIFKNVQLRVTDISGFDDFNGIDLKVSDCDDRQVELAPGQERKFQVIDQIISNNIGGAVRIGDDKRFTCYWFPDERQITLAALSDNGVRTERFWIEPNDCNEARLVRRKRRVILDQRAWTRWPQGTARKTPP